MRFPILTLNGKKLSHFKRSYFNRYCIILVQIFNVDFQRYFIDFKYDISIILELLYCIS